MMSEPSMDEWLAEAKQDPSARLCGMYLVHNGVVRATPKREAREGIQGLGTVSELELSYDQEGLQAALSQARALPGVHYVRAWLNKGTLAPGETLMYVLVGADIRPNCINALESLVETIKTEVVVERETLSCANSQEGQGGRR